MELETANRTSSTGLAGHLRDATSRPLGPAYAIDALAPQVQTRQGEVAQVRRGQALDDVLSRFRRNSVVQSLWKTCWRKDCLVLEPTFFSF